MTGEENKYMIINHYLITKCSVTIGRSEWHLRKECEVSLVFLCFHSTIRQVVWVNKTTAHFKVLKQWLCLTKKRTYICQLFGRRSDTVFVLVSSFQMSDKDTQRREERGFAHFSNR